MKKGGSEIKGHSWQHNGFEAFLGFVKLSQRRNIRKRRQKKKEEDEVEEVQEKEEEEEAAAAAQSVNESFKKVFSPLAIWKTQSITALRFYLSTMRVTNIKKSTEFCEDMGKEKSPFTAGGNVKKYNPYRNQNRQISKTTKKNKIAIWLS